MFPEETDPKEAQLSKMFWGGVHSALATETGTLVSPDTAASGTRASIDIATNGSLVSVDAAATLAHCRGARQMPWRLPILGSWAPLPQALDVLAFALPC